MQYHKFTNDYSEGAHPKILESLMNTNLAQHDGYGLDEHCRKAAELIRRECTRADSPAGSCPQSPAALSDGNSPACPPARSDLDVHFLAGGTQTNKIAISAALRPYQAVIAVSTGHINVHETGAIESSGHKVIAVPDEDGKLTVQAVSDALRSHTDEHMVQPGMVYISNTTELGTQYTKEELEALSRFCRLKGLYLFLDGARLGSALTSVSNDLTMADLADLTDAFYIGGTKNGALFGEALVIRNDSLKKDFRFMIKQNGALLAKGWLLGLQFEALFTDGLFYEMAGHSNAMAALLRSGFEECGFSFLSSSVSNQLFPIVDNSLAERLIENFGAIAERSLGDGRTAVRLVTSWATPQTAVETLVSVLKDWAGK